MKKSIAIIGLSRFGLNLVESFSNQKNVDVIAIDVDIESVRKASEFNVNAMVLDSTSEAALRQSGIANVDHAIVAIGQNDPSNLTACIMTVIKLKQLGVPKITARADEDDYEQVLRLVGADDIIRPLWIASERVANKITGNVVDYFNIKNDYDVFEVKIDSEFEPLPITELDTRFKYKMNILLIDRGGEIMVPTKDTILLPNDDIFIFGKKKDLHKITNLFS